MNKKLVLSVLSTAVVASMASAAMAKPQPGFYVGGDVDKYYSIDAFLGDHFDDALNDIISELGDTVFVDDKANAAPFVEALDANTAEELAAIMKPATVATFNGNVYANVGDPTAEPYNPAEDKDLEPGTPVGDLVVESVSAITKQGVTVSFPALTEAIEEATVEVKNNGTVVPVKAKLLDAGETTATFEFVTPLTAEPAGTWIVDGVSFDANAQAAVIAVNTAAGANGNQVKLLAALKSSYFNGVVDANIADYQVEMAGKTYVSVEEVQKAIDKVNKAKAGDAAADAVTKAKNEVELLAALQNGGFARVNADLISKYATYEEVPADPAAPDYKTANTATKVQAIIDAVNLIAAQDAVTAADTTADTALSADAISKAQALVSVLPTETDGDKAVKKSLQDRLDKANAVAKVKGATTQASLLSALKSPVLKLQKIDDTLAKYYKEKLVPADITSVSYNIQTNIIDAGKTAAIADYGKKISEVTEETSTADLKALLTELKRLDSTNFTADIVDGLLGKYRDALVAVTDKTSKDQPGEISGIVAAQNSPDTAIDAVNETAADDDADALLAALKAPTLNLKNVKDANKDAYLNAAVNKDGDKYFANVTTKEQVQKVVNAVNAYVDANKATTATELRTALTTFAVALVDLGGVNEAPAFIDLSNAAKLEVAEIVLNAKEEDFATAYELGQAVDAAMTAHGEFLNDVNTADSISAMNAALNNEDAFPAFYALDAADKVAKAEEVFNKLQELKDAEKGPKKFNTIAEIKAAAGL